MHTQSLDAATAALYVEPLTILPLGDTHPPGSALDLVEEMLKQRGLVDARLREPAQAPPLVPRFLAIALAGYSLFCVAAALLLQIAPSWPALVPESGSPAGNWLSLFAAYDLGLLGAIGICLPSFYFYALLSGVRVSMIETVAHAVRGHAVTALVLVGLLPIYLAIALGLNIFGARGEWIDVFQYLLLTLPFQASIAGAWALYQGFVPLCSTMPPRFARNRACFLRRLVLAWTVCSAVITPLVVYTIWVAFAGYLS